MCKTCITSLFPNSQGTTTTKATTTATSTSTTTTTTYTTACEDIWSNSKCKKKKMAGECDTSCVTSACTKTQANCRKKCKLCSQGNTVSSRFKKARFKKEFRFKKDCCYIQPNY